MPDSPQQRRCYTIEANHIRRSVLKEVEVVVIGADERLYSSEVAHISGEDGAFEFAPVAYRHEAGAVARRCIFARAVGELSTHSVSAVEVEVFARLREDSLSLEGEVSMLILQIHKRRVCRQAVADRHCHLLSSDSKHAGGARSDAKQVDTGA